VVHWCAETDTVNKKPERKEWLYLLIETAAFMQNTGARVYNGESLDIGAVLRRRKLKTQPLETESLIQIQL